MKTATKPATATARTARTSTASARPRPTTAACRAAGDIGKPASRRQPRTASRNGTVTTTNGNTHLPDRLKGFHYLEVGYLSHKEINRRLYGE
jgi:hypothetical protein